MALPASIRSFKCQKSACSVAWNIIDVRCLRKRWWSPATAPGHAKIGYHHLWGLAYEQPQGGRYGRHRKASRLRGGVGGRERRGVRMWAHGPRLGDVSALFPFPAHIHPIARDDDRHRHSEGRRLLPPGGVVVHHPLLKFDAPLGEATPRLRAGRSVAQGVEDSFAHSPPPRVMPSRYFTTADRQRRTGQPANQGGDELDLDALPWDRLRKAKAPVERRPLAVPSGHARLDPVAVPTAAAGEQG